MRRAQIPSGQTNRDSSARKRAINAEPLHTPAEGRRKLPIVEGVLIARQVTGGSDE